MNCGAELIFKDPNVELPNIVFHCQLSIGHHGPHIQNGIVENEGSKIQYTIQWSDPRERSKLVIPEIKVDQRILVPV